MAAGFVVGLLETRDGESVHRATAQGLKAFGAARGTLPALGTFLGFWGRVLFSAGHD
jgi:hypothetical protein